MVAARRRRRSLHIVKLYLFKEKKGFKKKKYLGSRRSCVRLEPHICRPVVPGGGRTSLMSLFVVPVDNG
jgi:hypothetical protein